MDILLSSAYLAPIQYYSKLIDIDANTTIYIEQYENYIKQSYRNRCSILGANGIQYLSIPVESANGLKIATKDVKISEHGNWQHIHWNAIISAYNSTPFFEYYQDYFYPFYHKKYSFLFDFNEELHCLISDLIDLEYSSVFYTEEYYNQKNCIDLRNSITPKIDWVLDENFESISYYQVFKDKYGFVDNLSIIDLLFNMGNESLIILMNSNKKRSSK